MPYMLFSKVNKLRLCNRIDKRGENIFIKTSNYSVKSKTRGFTQWHMLVTAATCNYNNLVPPLQGARVTNIQTQLQNNCPSLLDILGGVGNN